MELATPSAGLAAMERDGERTSATADDASCSERCSEAADPISQPNPSTPANDVFEDDDNTNNAPRPDDEVMAPPSTVPSGKESVGRGVAARRKRAQSDPEDGGSRKKHAKKQSTTPLKDANTRCQDEESEEEASFGGPKVKRSLSGAARQQELDAAKQLIGEQKVKLQKASSVIYKAREHICRSLVQIAKLDRERARDTLFREAARVGRCQSLLPYGQPCSWEGGTEAEALEQGKLRLREERASIDVLRRSLPRQLKAKALDADDGENMNSPEDGEDVAETREVCSYRAECLKKEEAALKDREQRLHMDRSLYLKQKMVVNAEEQSNFRHYPFLQDRYQLLNLIGKGGNSEVYEAFDLENMQACAVKIHEIDRRMAEHQRQDFVRHALREYEIQKTLNHPRIVRLYDCFAPSKNVFATVLELCKGDTLDSYMKRNGPLPEKDAKNIIVQILAGLRHLNSCGRRIIHYDLKPGNVFFHCGQVKIADFGLSKVVDQPSCETIELTSKGAGTYWYLPPECCDSGGVPMISNKVDVWATGVIFYELLFNRRPFGHGQSQEAFIRSAGMVGTFEVVIPHTPRVSPEAKEFLQRLLTPDRSERPDVLQAASDSYLRRR